MSDSRDLDAVADACIAAHEAVGKHGTDEMRRLMRVVLFLVAKELADRGPRAPPADGHDAKPS